MQDKNLIPTPLSTAPKSRRVIEVAEPTLPSRVRFIKITLFLFGTLLRSLAARLWPPLKETRYSPLQQARRLRAFMEKMGGLWVKVGQILALRRDLFEEEFCNELTRLQDRACGFPGIYSRRIIEADLDKSVEECFSEFDNEPLAAASVGQTHLARLRGSNAQVVVKVQRPNVAESFARDLRYFYVLIWILTRAKIAPHFRWGDLYSELSHTILEELDYGQEAASLRRMRKTLRAHKIYVPKVYLELCTERILVMEMVEGTYMSEFIHALATDPERTRAWLKENKISARRVGRRLLFSHYRQVFEDNLYHCDLHPGNILLMKRSRITLIDFGSVGTNDKTQLTKLAHMFTACGARDYQKCADLFLIMAPALPTIDLTDIKEKIVRAFREYEPLTRIKTLQYHQKALGVAIGKIVQILAQGGVQASWDMLRANRAQTTLDASLMFLFPDVNYPKVMRVYIEQMRKRQQKKLQSTKQFSLLLAKFGQILNLPAKMAENAYFDGEYVRRRAFKYEGYLSTAAQVWSYVFTIVSRIWLFAGLFGILAFLHQRYDVLHRLRTTWIYRVFDNLPDLDSSVWIVGVLAALHVSRELGKIINILNQPEPSRVHVDRR